MKLLSTLLVLFCFISCSVIEADKTDHLLSENSAFDNMHIPEGFNFETFSERTLQLDYSFDINFMSVEIYISEEMSKESLYFKGGIKKGDIADVILKVPVSQKKVWVKTKTSSIPSIYQIPLDQDNNRTTLSHLNAIDKERAIEQSSNARLLSEVPSISTKLGTCDDQGVPNYLTTSDVITQDFIDDVGASLINGVTVNPEYLSNESLDIDLIKETDLYITFLSEGTSYKNPLCFYVYDTSNPPTQTSDIDSLIVVFPNSSFTNLGGGLTSGDKVHLGRFSSGKSIGFVLFENGWSGSLTNFNTSQAFYSNLIFNNNSKQMMTILEDPQRKRFILGFDDCDGCARDLEDVLFYMTADSHDAIGNNFPEIQYTSDDDGDGVINENDEYPNDIERAYLVNIPNSTLVFEDNWPNKGDYDFNDLVLNYSGVKVLNSNYKIKDIKLALTINSIGGYYHNGFGFEWPIESSNIESITGQNLSKGITNNNSNGTEISTNTNTVIIAFEDAYSLMEAGSGESVINAIEGGYYKTPHTQNLNITFVSDQVWNTEISSLSNPFIFINQHRGREVHLPDKTPTSNYDQSLFNTEDDKSSTDGTSTYKSSNGAPWALEIPGDFKYPEENVNINDAYSGFSSWVESGGLSNQLWYNDHSSSLLYNKE